MVNGKNCYFLFIYLFIYFVRCSIPVPASVQSVLAVYRRNVRSQMRWMSITREKNATASSSRDFESRNAPSLRRSTVLPRQILAVLVHFAIKKASLSLGCLDHGIAGMS